MATLDNANPTILSASQLPTRQKKSEPRRGPDSKYDDIIFAKPSYLSGPFGQGPAAWPRMNDWQDEFSSEAIDEQEIYDLISTISDPEHPVSLGQLSVINLSDIHITPSPSMGVPDPNTIVQVVVEITPTITHWSTGQDVGNLRLVMTKASIFEDYTLLEGFNITGIRLADLLVRTID
ncbi:hypothetical protein ACJA88_008623 [Fusarium oxysporum]